MGDFFDRFSRIPLSQKILLLVLILAAIFVGFYMSLFSPLDEEIAQKQERAAELAVERSRVQDLQSAVEQLTQQLAEEGDVSGNILQELPSDEYYSQLLAVIEDTAKEVPPSDHGALVLNNVRRDPNQPGPNYTRMPIRLSLTGTYEQVIDFTWRLANLSRIIHVRSVNLRVGTAPPVGPPVLNVSLNIEAFFRPA
jgi:type IV pilus assembly protein PilO